MATDETGEHRVVHELYRSGPFLYDAFDTRGTPSNASMLPAIVQLHDCLQQHVSAVSVPASSRMTQYYGEHFYTFHVEKCMYRDMTAVYMALAGALAVAQPRP